MSLTLEQRKERYYKFAQEKANEIYDFWQTNGIKSKHLVAKANEYAFDNRLKTDVKYRFYAFAFALALGIRLEKRYGTFFRRLFRFFAYIRERNALKALRRVLGFDSYTDIREMLDVEAEKITILLANRRNGQSTGGGKHIETGDITLDEELNSFFEECMAEDEQNEVGNWAIEKENKLNAHDEPFFVNAEDTHREKISVEEFGKGASVGEQKKKDFPTKIEQPEKQTTKAVEMEIVEKEQIENPIEKTVANTSILAETTVLEQEKKADLSSPFPVFRENPESKSAVKRKEDFTLSKENNETKMIKEDGESLDKDICVETEREKSPFPVFDKNKPLEIKTPEKTVEKEVKVAKESDVIKGNSELIAITEVQSSGTMTMHALSNISEENKARVALNITMREKEIQVMAEQIKMAAKMEMAMEEQAWREQISIAKTGNEMKVESKENAPPPNKDVVTTGLQK